MLKKIICISVTVVSLCFCRQASAQYGFPSFADLAERLLPTVVNISTIQKTEKLDIALPDNVDGDIAAAAIDTDDTSDDTESRQALGSGFIIDEQGYIITNYHVIENAKSINVVLFDNTEVEAEIIGGDEKTDLALIKIEPPFDLDKVTFGNSDELRIGDWVLSIGNPFGLGGSVSAGIVSAKSRDIAAGPYDNFIQTDASINQGSSGGPMFNMKGEVIGINTALFSTTGVNMGVGFAIPINTAGWIASQLEQNGTVKRGWIGIKIQSNNKDVARDLKINDNQGVIVSEVTENSPAAKAGINAGDVILSLGKTEISNSKDFSRLVAESPIGKKITLVLLRGQQVKTVNVMVQEMPVAPKIPSISGNASQKNMTGNDQIAYELGIKLREINSEIIKAFNLSPATMGLVVEGVEANSDAALQGIKKGDVVLKIDKKDVLTTDAALNYIREAKQDRNRPVMLMIQDQEQGIIGTVSVKLKKHE